MRVWRGFFALAGLFNLAGGLWGFFHPLAPWVDAGMAPPRYPFAFQLLLLAVAILGVGYLIVASDPPAHRGLVWIGLLTKIAGAAMTWWAVADGQLPAAARWQPLVVDLPWAVGFALFLGLVRPHVEPPRGQSSVGVGGSVE